MKSIQRSLVVFGLACLAITGDLKAANDRFYIAGISPAATAPLTTTNFQLNVTNDLKNGPTHAIKQIKVTLPAGFTLMPLPAGGPAVTAPPHWTASVAGQIITLTTSGTYALPAGKSVAILVNARTPAALANCAPQSYTWALAVSQGVDGGTGNDFLLRTGTKPATVTVAATTCLTLTNLVLNSVVPNAISTTGTGTVVTLTATLTRSDNNAPLPGEPLTFTVGAEPITCSANAITDANGVATCSYMPQAAPNTPLTAGNYDAFASFAGDAVPDPDLAPQLSNPLQLTVNATGTGVSVTDATGPFGGAVDLHATLTSSGSGVAGRTISFFLNAVSVGTAVTDGSGMATLPNTSIVGINAGPHPTYIEADFAGDGIYSTASGTATLTVTAISSNIGLSNLTQTYTGTALSPTVTTSPSGISYNLAGAPQTNAGSYPVTATITDPNYTGSASGTFVISQATVVAHITAADKPYDGTMAAGITSCTLTGVMAADTGNVTCTASGMFASANVGSWLVTATSVTLGGSAMANYQLSPTMPTTTANISQKPASVTPNADGKVFGGVDPTLMGVLAGFLPGDSVTATYSRTPGETVAGSPYTISATLGPVGVLPNYLITYNTANFNITQGTPVLKFTTYMVAASSASTGAVTFSTNSAPTVCTVSPAGLVTITGPGACNILADQAADANYKAAPQRSVPVTQ